MLKNILELEGAQELSIGAQHYFADFAANAWDEIRFSGRPGQ